MNWLEARFRKQFVPQGDAFLYREYDRDVVFEAFEVEAFVEEWWQSWRSPLLWSMMLLFGVAVPGALWLYEPDAWYLLAGISMVALGTSIWQLVDIGRDVKAAASTMEPVGPGHGRPNYWPEPLLVLWLVYNLALHRDEGVFSIVVIGVLVALIAGMPLYRFLKSRRHPARLALTQGSAA